MRLCPAIYTGTFAEDRKERPPERRNEGKTRGARVHGRRNKLEDVEMLKREGEKTRSTRKEREGGKGESRIEMHVY